MNESQVPGALTASIIDTIRRVEEQRRDYPDGIIPVGVLIAELEKAHPGISFSPRLDSNRQIAAIDVFNAMGSFRVQLKPVGD